MIPIYSHPTTILFLDDNIDYLKNLSLHLPRNLFSYKLYNNPQKALVDLSHNYNSRTYASTHWQLVNPRHLDSCVIEIDIPNLYTQCYNPNRFSSVSTIIIDYDMPDINGLEFLQKINFPEIQKILLTGVADTDIAIDAFNKGIIDLYIPKQNLDIESQLTNNILKSQACYFRHISSPTIKVLERQEDYPSALMEKEFKVLFDDLVKSFNVIEYFLLDTVGSFLLLTSSGEAIILYLQNEDQVESYYNDIKELDIECFSDEEKDIIKSRNKIFCYKPFNEERLPDPSLWKQYYCDAKTLKGTNKFYYSIHKIDKINLQKIVSFNSYLKTHRSIE